MPEPKPYKLGDPCPGCGGQLEKAQQPTDAQRAAAANPNPNDWVPIPPHFDTAPKAVVEELGELWRCPRCGYPHREKPKSEAA